MGLEILIAMNAKIKVFWDATRHSLADTYVPYHTAAQPHTP